MSLQISSIIFERGVEARLAKNGVLLFCSSVKNHQEVNVLEFLGRHKLKPILLIEEYESSKGPDQIYRLLATALSEETFLLEHKALSAALPSISDMPNLFETFNLKYILGGAEYHFMQLARSYVEISNNYSNSIFTKINEDSKHRTFAGQSQPYHEFEAFILSANRTYEATRHMLWRTFQKNQGSTPSSFERVLDKGDKIPDDFKQRLTKSWEKHGSKVHDYRDCIQHYVPLTPNYEPYAAMEKLENTVWTTHIPIPDNPEVRSQKAFKYNQNLDALTFAWHTIEELMQFVVAIIDKLERIEPQSSI